MPARQQKTGLERKQLKRPGNAYLQFMSDYLKKNTKDKTFAEAMGAVSNGAQQWKSMDDEEKAPFYKLAKDATDKYEKEKKKLGKVAASPVDKDEMEDDDDPTESCSNESIASNMSDSMDIDTKKTSGSSKSKGRKARVSEASSAKAKKKAAPSKSRSAKSKSKSKSCRCKPKASATKKKSASSKKAASGKRKKGEATETVETKSVKVVKGGKTRCQTKEVRKFCTGSGKNKRCRTVTTESQQDNEAKGRKKKKG